MTGVLIVAVAATALAASPSKGAKFKGTLLTYKEGKLSGPIVNGNYHAPVSFTVSSTGTDLLSFKYGYTGCFGSGGKITSNPFDFPDSRLTVGTVRVSAAGSFKATGVASVYKGSSYTTTTTSSVTGTFTTASKASGTIVLSQRERYTISGKTYNEKCGPVSLTFTATS